MTDEQRADEARGALPFALLRATLVVVIFVSERLVDARRLDGTGFWVVLGCAVAYAALGIAVAAGAPGGRILGRVQPGLDVLLIAGLAYSSGGAFSDVRRAFFVVPLAAAFTERPRSTATWSIFAVFAFTLQAVIHGGHISGSVDSWQRVTVSQDLYLAWSGAAATILAIALSRRTARTEALAASRQQLVTHAIDAVERERTRLAGALHDEPVQSLMAARHDLRRAQRTGDPDSFARLHQALDVTIAELREEIFNLHPHVLDHVGLGAAIEQVAQRHASEAGVRIEVAVDAEVPLDQRQVLFWLGRELLGNAAKHASASTIRVKVVHEPSTVTLEVADDGDGIREGCLHEALLEGHIGLAEIRERIAALTGSLSIATAPGAGTTVTVSLPAGSPHRAPDAETPDRGTPVDTLPVSTA